MSKWISLMDLFFYNLTKKEEQILLNIQKELNNQLMFLENK